MATRIPAFIIGLFLLAVWISGLSLHARSWLTWLDGAGAVAAFAVAAMPAKTHEAARRGPLLAVLWLGLFVLWILGLVERAQSWIVWSTFAAACAVVVVGFGLGSLGGRTATPEA
jgi:hypothetical protein